MVEAYFQLVRGTVAAGTFRSDPATGGPWSSQLQHGGPPSALLVLVAEALALQETGRTDLIAMRISVEFVGPVPVADLHTSARLIRAAKAAVLIEATLSAGGRDCLNGRIWLVRSADTSAIAHLSPTQDDPSPGLRGLGASFPYADSIEWRSEAGGLDEPGPGRIWARPNRTTLSQIPLSGLQRAALVGDSASGVSAELDWATWSFVNIDLDVHLARPVIGEWLLLDAQTQLGGAGAALARSTLSDAAGPVGATSQTLVLEPRRG